MSYSPEREMARGNYPPLPPKGYLSEPRPCPICGKRVKGRKEGMVAHMWAMHRAKRGVALDAIRRAKITWSSEDEIRAAQEAADARP